MALDQQAQAGVLVEGRQVDPLVEEAVAGRDIERGHDVAVAGEARGQVIDPQGNLRPKRVVVLAAAVAGAVGLVLWRRSR